MKKIEIKNSIGNKMIQGTAADMVKVAVYLTYNHIHDHGLQDEVRMIMQVHDQLDTNAVEGFEEQWRSILNDLMEQAGKFSIPSGILKAETTITERWSK